MEEQYKGLGTTMRDGAGGAGCAVVLGLLLLASFAFGGGLETESAPTPTPTLDNDAALVHEVGQIVQPVVEAAADAVRADIQTAHATATPVPPSEMVQLGHAWGLPAALSLLCAGSCILVVVLAFLWNAQSKRQAELERQRITAQIATDRLDAIEERLTRLAREDEPAQRQREDGG